MTEHSWTADEGTEERLDRYLARHLELSRNRITNLLAEGQIRVDGAVPKKSHVVLPGQTLVVVVPAPIELEALPEAIPVEIVFQDDDLAVVDKPAGLVVHPGAGHPTGTLVNALLHHIGDLSGIGGKLRPGIVHRLDKDTSGLMVVAKSDRAHQGLSEALKAREVQRIYAAAVWGRLREDVIEIDEPIGRDDKDRKRMAVHRKGRAAQSRFRSLEMWRTATFCDVELKTGRTHQIRVHAAHFGHPVVGDALYGAARERGFSGPNRTWAGDLSRRVSRQFLHARRLRFVHPVSGEELAFEIPLPQDLQEVREWALATAG